jgi:hypothetical protein
MLKNAKSCFVCPGELPENRQDAVCSLTGSAKSRITDGPMENHQVNFARCLQF